MANPIESAKHYLISVAERTVGISAWREATELTRDHPEPVAPWMGNLLYSFGANFCPMTTEFFLSASRNPEPMIKHSDLYCRMMLGALSTDVALYAPTILLAHNPLEVIAYRLTTNAAAHVSLDLAGAAINRIRHFKPSGFTLTI